jgi:O-antigen/teichoic acid export membrane protein
MSTLQRLLSNTVFAFASNVIIRASNSLLFILIGRSLGASPAGMFNLGITYFTVVFALSAFGLHELMVREVAGRREESGRYLVHYLLIRLVMAGASYLLLLLFLDRVLPYQEATKVVIRILVLAVFPEAIFGLVQALFEAHERLWPPAVVATVNSIAKVGIGWYLLASGESVTTIVWVIPASSSASLLLFLPFLRPLLRQSMVRFSFRFDRRFAMLQLRQTPAFILIHLFSLLDYQTDAFVISLLLTETDVGWYGAAQTIMLALWMIPTAVRGALYPLMARYRTESIEKLALLYQKSSQYLAVLVFPLAAGTWLVAPQLIDLIFGEAFAPAIPALRWSIWAVVFGLLNVPSARLLLVYQRQRAAALLTAFSMVVNIISNLLLVPLFGIAGAAMARTIASAIFFIVIYFYANAYLLHLNLLSVVVRPMLASAVMTLLIWPLQGLDLVIPVFAGTVAYGVAILLFRGIPTADWHYWKELTQLGRRRALSLNSDLGLDQKDIL